MICNFPDQLADNNTFVDVSGATIILVCRRFPYARLIQRPIPPDKHYRRPLEGQDLSRTTAIVWEPTVEIKIKTTLSRSIV